MTHFEIIGLPILISARYRIVLDQGLCRRYKIPESGVVWTKIDSHTISIYPDCEHPPQAQRKQVTIGRFNLPVQWVKENKAKVGSYAYLLQTESCLQIRILPWTVRQCRKDRILGLPIKIYKGNQLYIPKNFWIHYGIEQNHGRIVREQRGSRLIFRKCRPETSFDSHEIVHADNRHVLIKSSWMRSNHLAVGDTLWLFGTSGGPVVSARPICNENFNSNYLKSHA